MRLLPDQGEVLPIIGVTLPEEAGYRLATALNISSGMSQLSPHIPDRIQEHGEALHSFFIPRSGNWPQPRMETTSGLDLALAAKAFVNLILEASLCRADAKLWLMSTRGRNEIRMGETRWNGHGQGEVLIAFHLDFVCAGHLAPNKLENGSSAKPLPKFWLTSQGDTKSIIYRVMGMPTEP